MIQIQVPRSLQAMVARVGKHLVEVRGLLTQAEFDAAKQGYYRLFALLQTRPELGLPPPPLMFWLDNLFPRLTVSDVLEARAAWYGEEVLSAAKLVKREPALLRQRLMPVPRGFVAKGRIGSIALALGWVDRARLASAVELQRTLKRELGVDFLLGSLLAARGDLAGASLFQLLALQLGVPFRRFDLESVDRVKRAYLARLLGRTKGVKAKPRTSTRRTVARPAVRSKPAPLKSKKRAKAAKKAKGKSRKKAAPRGR